MTDMTLKLLKVLVLLFTLNIPLLAQTDNANLIADIYQRASQFYEEDKFQECLTLLTRAETINSGVDPKLLYLKIKARHSLYQQDKTQRAELVKEINSFNETVAKQPYAAEKVREIVALKQRLDSESIEEKNAKERLEMEALRTKELNKNKYEEQILLLEPDIERAKSKRSTGRFLNTLGALTSIGYAAFMISSWDKLVSDEPGLSNEIIAGSGIPLLIVFFVGGSSAKSKGKSIMKEVEQKKSLLNKQYLSLEPQIKFGQGSSQFGLAIKMRF